MIPLGNAAGRIKYPREVEPLLRVDSEILKYITLGSYTLEPRHGNSGNTFWNDDCIAPSALNALGLPNPGIEVPRQFLELGTALQQAKRIGRISVAGFSIEDYEMLALKLRHLYGTFYQLELNLGCPNVREDGEQHSIFSFKPELIDEVIRRVWKVYDTTGLSIGLKLSPYSDPGLLKEVAAVIASHDPHVTTVVTCNTFPNAYAYDHFNKPAIDANDGYAGLSGNPMKHIALGQVRQFRDALPKSISIAGVGGISCAQDVHDMEQAGADWVQIGTAYFISGNPRVFQRIAEEYAQQFEQEVA